MHIYQELKSILTPILQNETVLVHSSYGATKEVMPHLSPEAIVACIVDAVGPDGTAIFPTFNFDYCDGVPFDPETTVSQMGAISESARKHSWAMRYPHPIYSCSYFSSDDIDYLTYPPRTCYGEGSVFDYVRQENAIIMILGLPWNESMTFFHHVEECAKVPYRHYKEFFSADMYVRNDGVITDVEPMGKILEASGIVQTHPFFPMMTMRANDVFDATYELIAGGAPFHEKPGLLYTRGAYTSE